MSRVSLKRMIVPHGLESSTANVLEAKVQSEHSGPLQKQRACADGINCETRKPKRRRKQSPGAGWRVSERIWRPLGDGQQRVQRSGSPLERGRSAT